MFKEANVSFDDKLTFSSFIKASDAVLEGIELNFPVFQLEDPVINARPGSRG